MSRSCCVRLVRSSVFFFFGWPLEINQKTRLWPYPGDLIRSSFSAHADSSRWQMSSNNNTEFVGRFMFCFERTCRISENADQGALQFWPRSDCLCSVNQREFITASSRKCGFVSCYELYQPTEYSEACCELRYDVLWMTDRWLKSFAASYYLHLQVWIVTVTRISNFAQCRF